MRRRRIYALWNEISLIMRREEGKEGEHTVEVRATNRCSRSGAVLLSVGVVTVRTTRCRGVRRLSGVHRCWSWRGDDGSERRESRKWRNGRSEKLELCLQAVEMSRELW